MTTALVVLLSGCQLPPHEQIRTAHDDPIAVLAHVPNRLGCDHANGRCAAFDQMLRSEVTPYTAKGLSRIMADRGGKCLASGPELLCAYEGRTSRSNVRFRHVLLFDYGGDAVTLRLTSSRVFQNWVEG